MIVKFKILFFLTLGLLACTFASAQSFGFASASGALYCNYIVVGSDQEGVGIVGVDNLSACGDSLNSTIAGFVATVPNRGQAAHGAGVVYGDSIYAVTSGDSQAMWAVFNKLKCNKVNKSGHYTGPLGWYGIAAFSGFAAGTNEGYVSCTIPGKNGAASTKGPSTGAMRSRAKKE